MARGDDRFSRCYVAKGSIVADRHFVNVMPPNDSHDHYSSRSAASGLRRHRTKLARLTDRLASFW